MSLIDMEKAYALLAEASRIYGAPFLLFDIEGKKRAQAGDISQYCQSVEKKIGKSLYGQEVREHIWSLEKEARITICQSGMGMIMALLVAKRQHIGCVVVPSLYNKSVFGGQVRRQIPNIAKITGMAESILNDEVNSLKEFSKEEIIRLARTAELLASTISTLCIKEGREASVIRKLETLNKFTDQLLMQHTNKDVLARAAYFFKHELKLSNCLIRLTDRRMRYTGFHLTDMIKQVERRLFAYVQNTKTLVHIKDPRSSFLLKGVHNIEDMEESILVLPIIRGNEVIGTISFYSEHNFNVDDDTLDLVLSLAEKLSFAIHQDSSIKEMRATAHTDVLTKLYNRRFLQEYVRNRLKEHKESKTPSALALFDIDNFKKYNDMYGHQAGDDVLAQIGEIVRKSISKGDYACRYGGEEFAVFMPETQYKDAVARASSLRKDVEEHNFTGVPEGARKVTISMGVIGCADSSMSFSEMVSEADKNLYRAKELGKNTVVDSIVLGKGLNPINSRDF